MNIHLINLFYFVIVGPIIIISLLLISKLYKNEKNNQLKIIFSISILLFIIRLGLVFFSSTIGIIPYLIEDILFYSLLLAFGLIFTWYYLYKIEKSTFKEIGFMSINKKKTILFGVIGIIVLMIITPLIIILTNMSISIPPNISLGKIIIALCFGFLGAIYEEIMFRGIIQKHLSQLFNDNWRIILSTAVIFTLTHLFYLPFAGFGIYYIFVFIMAVLLSWLGIKLDLLTCALIHGGIVFILILFV